MPILIKGSGGGGKRKSVSYTVAGKGTKEISLRGISRTFSDVFDKFELVQITPAGGVYVVPNIPGEAVLRYGFIQKASDPSCYILSFSMYKDGWSHSSGEPVDKFNITSDGFTIKLINGIFGEVDYVVTFVVEIE